MWSSALSFLTAVLNSFFSDGTGGSFLRVTARVHEIYQLLDELSNEPDFLINRALITRVHNGGGNLSSSRPTYWSILYEETRGNISSLYRGFQNIPADKYAMQFFQKIRLEDAVTVLPAGLPDSTAQDIMLSDKLLITRSFFIKERRKGILKRQVREVFIFTISSQSNTSFDNPALKSRITQLIAQLRQKL